ncbi:SAM-dependent methyltransferase [Streptomyces hydrogenans]|uniref:SAM-dependent methyltransferase n=1 Tax=Streptomyces hydrogenans TaxID=1873719 RepID=UPI003441B3D3
MDRKYVLDRTVDFTRPSVARMYDYYLGGHDNYPVDREACGALLQRVPARDLAFTQQSFHRRVVRSLVEDHGIRQILDIGCGFPTGRDTHHIAQDIAGGTRVVYVDRDPMVVNHGRALLEGDGRTAVVQADLRDTACLFGEPRLSRLLDLGRPVGVLLVSVLHCVPDSGDPEGSVRQILDRLSSGSYVAISHLASDDADAAQNVSRFMRDAADWGSVRTPSQVSRFFDGLEILAPGLGDVALWDAAGSPGKAHSRGLFEFGGVGRLP